ncbi:hypothetical protein BDN72DRAFT_961011 [Pluteus cervinus]|uniref:Uncharacterized protein n=1 Tax=Pluteus cervinus TaxID=181527 RepID=A0ACD3ANY4_9AGAR|nr:hypothetical protein BDN72DRAFT_961011 [Pluteus cervinus]
MTSDILGSIHISACQRALSDEAILTRIIWFCEMHGAGRIALARTSKMFFQPAIKPLWKTCFSLLPLLKLLPEDCWDTLEKLGPNARTVTIFALKRNLTPKDCERLRLYAKYISWIYHDSLETWAHYNVFYQLKQACGSDSLTPHLSSLTWIVADEDFFPAYTLFVHPDLPTLYVSLLPRTGGTTKGRFAALMNLSIICPNLVDLHLHDSTDFDAVTLASPMVLGFSTLGTLEIDGVSSDVFMYLTQFDNLRGLTIGKVDNIDWIAVRQYVGPNLAFPKLAKLSIRCSTFTSSIELLRLRKPPLSTLCVILQGICTRDEWIELLHAVREQCEGNTLESLELCDRPRPVDDAVGGEPTPAPPVQPSLTMEHIQPFLSLRSIQRLSFTPACGTDLNDDNICAIAQALPRLEKLELHTDNRNPSPLHWQKLTIASLVHLARYCPDICHISMWFDASSLALDLARSRLKSEDLQRHKQFIFLSTGNSSIDDPEAVAAFLEELFCSGHLLPRPGSPLAGEEAEAPLFRDRWTKVRAILRSKIASTTGIIY